MSWNFLIHFDKFENYEFLSKDKWCIVSGFIIEINSCCPMELTPILQKPWSRTIHTIILFLHLLDNIVQLRFYRVGSKDRERERIFNPMPFLSNEFKNRSCGRVFHLEGLSYKSNLIRHQTPTFAVLYFKRRSMIMHIECVNHEWSVCSKTIQAQERTVQFAAAISMHIILGTSFRKIGLARMVNDVFQSDQSWTIDTLFPWDCFSSKSAR